ncbi:hypothetical protein H4S02_001233 [Coemansia sp. RSA 2611]|nr:hypothetical protein H4S02_001233 [Coemansia sp. RSA 2611]
MLSRLLLGVGASVAGSLGHSLGMTLQKRAHMQHEAASPGRPLWKDRQWQLGLLLYLFSSTAPPTIALSMLPVFVAAPLAAVGLVANAVFARYILDSTFARTDAMGTLLVTMGSCCVALFGAIDEPPLSLGQLLRLYKRPAYVLFFSVYALLVAVLIVAEMGWRRRYARASEAAGSAMPPNVPLGSVGAPRGAGHVEAEPLLRTSPAGYSSVEYGAGVEIKSTRAEQVARYVSGFLSAVISGLICSQTLLLAKSGIGLVLLTVHGDMQFNDPLAIAIVVGLVVTALANLYYIQRALRLCSTLTVVPLCYCSSSLSALLSSLVYFDQIRLLTPIQISMIAAGIVLLAAGVLLLSMKAEPHEGPLHLGSESSDDE